MKTETIIANNVTFLKIGLLPVVQKGNQFYVGKILAYDLLNTYTVRPAEYDVKKHNSLANTFQDDNEYYNFLVEKDQQRIDAKDFQRDYDPSRVNKIVDFLDNEEYPFFPNTIIATCDLINNVDELGISSNSSIDEFSALTDRPSHLSFLQNTGESYYLYVPRTDKAILVIDGQHRLRGLEKSSEEIKNNYELLISFIIDFDRSVIAKLFYTINYEQKSVNKSLLYHLTGEFSSELDELTFMHNVVKVLNELDYSPFYNKIKMLGKTPKYASIEEKKSLTISQAFLIDYLLKSISIHSRNSTFQPIFLYYFKKQDLQIEIIRFLIKYFNAIKEIKINDWENPSSNILTKGMGIAALIRVMHLLFVDIFVNDWDLDPFKIKSISKDFLKQKMEGLENVDLSKDGEFGGVGSGGTINKLTQKITENVSFSGGLLYNDYLDKFRTNELVKFKTWLSKNI